MNTSETIKAYLEAKAEWTEAFNKERAAKQVHTLATIKLETAKSKLDTSMIMLDKFLRENYGSNRTTP